MLLSNNTHGCRHSGTFCPFTVAAELIVPFDVRDISGTFLWPLPLIPETRKCSMPLVPRPALTKHFRSSPLSPRRVSQLQQGLVLRECPQNFTDSAHWRRACWLLLHAAQAGGWVCRPSLRARGLTVHVVLVTPAVQGPQEDPLPLSYASFCT